MFHDMPQMEALHHQSNGRCLIARKIKKPTATMTTTPAAIRNGDHVVCSLIQRAFSGRSFSTVAVAHHYRTTKTGAGYALNADASHYPATYQFVNRVPVLAAFRAISPNVWTSWVMVFGS